MRRVVIAGSTGSIGKAALEIIEAAPSDFDLCGLSAGRNTDELTEQLHRHPRARFAVRDAETLDRAIGNDPAFEKRATGYGAGGLRALISETRPELVLNAVVGIAGLVPTMTALESNCLLALANKESLFTAGELIMEYTAENDDRIIPVDSEHFSLSRCLRGHAGNTDELILTASGGPFRGRAFSELGGVNVEEVLDHPTWRMGKRVTVDSALLLNKGLEVVEAHWLFSFPYDRIKVVIHPQSIVHSFVRLRDGSLLAHLGPADMRLSIMNALYYPVIKEFPWRSIAPEELGKLEFEPFERDRYPAFRLALEAAVRGGTVPAVLNAADEMAVDAFVGRKIRFLEIIEWIEEAVDAHTGSPVRAIDDVFKADRWTRDFLNSKHPGSLP